MNNIKLKFTTFNGVDDFDEWEREFGVNEVALKSKFYVRSIGGLVNQFNSRSDFISCFPTRIRDDVSHHLDAGTLEQVDTPRLQCVGGKIDGAMEWLEQVIGGEYHRMGDIQHHFDSGVLLKIGGK